MADIQDPLLIGRNTEGKLVKRPLSPHLQIYKPQITTVLSIFHRITGIALSLGTLLLVWWLVAAATSPDAFSRVQNFIGSPIGWLLMFGWTLACSTTFSRASGIWSGTRVTAIKSTNTT